MLTPGTSPFLCLETSEGKAAVDKVLTFVRGGTTATVATMRAKLDKDGIIDLDTIREWARSIADNPALLKSEVRVNLLSYVILSCALMACLVVMIVIITVHRTLSFESRQ